MRLPSLVVIRQYRVMLRRRGLERRALSLLRSCALLSCASEPLQTEFSDPAAGPFEPPESRLIDHLDRQRVQIEEPGWAGPGVDESPPGALRGIPKPHEHGL